MRASTPEQLEDWQTIAEIFGPKDRETEVVGSYSNTVDLSKVIDPNFEAQLEEVRNILSGGR